MALCAGPGWGKLHLTPQLSDALTAGLTTTLQQPNHLRYSLQTVAVGCSAPLCIVCRATTVYLVQRRIDMLPKPLTEDICSLRGGVERLAFSVLWEMSPDVDVVNVRWGRHAPAHLQ